jgi:hypothetical protein
LAGFRPIILWSKPSTIDSAHPVLRCFAPLPQKRQCPNSFPTNLSATSPKLKITLIKYSVD